MKTKSQNIISWVSRIIGAVILLQTLVFEFTAAPESVELFTTLGMEPIGRIGTGVIELIAGILLLVPRTAWAGAIISLGVISGAIFSHLTILGINYNADGGALFTMAVIVFVTSAVALWLERESIPFLNKFLAYGGIGLLRVKAGVTKPTACQPATT